MRTINSPTYTNVALTVVILFLAVLLVRPHVRLSEAQAGEELRSEQSKALAQLNSNADNAAATRELANATREIARAIEKTAKAQDDMAHAMTRLGAESK